MSHVIFYDQFGRVTEVWGFIGVIVMLVAVRGPTLYSCAKLRGNMQHADNASRCHEVAFLASLHVHT